MSKLIPVEVWYSTARVVLNNGEYASIRENFDCAIGIESKAGPQYFICQKIQLENGEVYVLERYDLDKQTVFYRRRK